MIAKPGTKTTEQAGPKMRLSGPRARGRAKSIRNELARAFGGTGASPRDFGGRDRGRPRADLLAGRPRPAHFPSRKAPSRRRRDLSALPADFRASVRGRN